MEPEDIPLGWYTHINFAFALVHPKTFRITHMDDGTASRYRRVSALKAKDPELQVWIAIGGWAMNDPGPYRTTFSDLAKSTSAQDAFFDSLVTFLVNNNYDGVDIDWEYPVAEDRGGIKEDFTNYANFLKRLRERLNSTGRKYGVSLTLVSRPLRLFFAREYADGLITAGFLLVSPRVRPPKSGEIYRLVQHHDIRYPYVSVERLTSGLPYQQY